MLDLAVDWPTIILHARESAGALGPECLLVAVACIAILVDLVTPRERSGATLSWIALFGTFGALALAWQGFHQESRSIFWGSLSVDRFAAFFKFVILFGTIFSIVLVHESVELRGRAMGEFYGLLLSAVAGMCLMAGANDMVTAFLAVELVSIPSFALVAYLRRDRHGTEAALKYVLYSAFSSGCMLFGLSILFGLSGSTSFARLGTVLTAGSGTALTASVACLLAFAGFAFKMAAAPFHFWAPDVYQGAPTPVTAWLSVTSKAGAVALFIRFVLSFTTFPFARGTETAHSSLTFEGFDWVTALMVISAVTMTIGNLGALYQRSLKRLLAYSSVAHVGYVLMGVAAMVAEPGAGGSLRLPTGSGAPAAAFYLAAYLFMNLGAFACVLAVENVTGSDDLSSFRALGRRAPIVAVAFTIFLFALIGLPPTAGFTGKFQLFAAAIEEAKARPGFWWLVAAGGANSVVSVYYYLKVARTMFFEGVLDPEAREPLPVSWSLTFVSAFLVFPVLLFGVFFSSILQLTSSLELLRS